MTSASASLASFDKFFQQEDAAYIPFIPNPVSDNKILPDDLYFEGTCSNLVKLAAAPGEFEPASVIIRALKNLPEVLLTPEALTNVQTGESIPVSALDIKLVKCWYQAGTALVSTEQRREQKIMVPELLLNDPSLVKVDTKRKNYLKLTFPNRQVIPLISDPQEKTEGPTKFVTAMNSCSGASASY